MKEINGREESTVTSDSQGGMFDKYKRKFAQEARSLKSLNHPHIVKVMDFFEANNTYYYVMDYLCGGSIDDLIGRESYLAEDIAISYARQIGDALGYMHENKILHLDMKPNNVMLNADGEAIVIDFGLSKQYDENGEPESSTTVGGGTVGYAPLEQSTHHDGKGFPVTMDVYALGATLYKMLVGVRAPEASSILNDGFPTQNLHQRNVSLETTKAIEKSMAPMKKDRFQSISEFINHLPKVKSNIHVVDVNVESESTTTDNNVVKSKKRNSKEKQILSLAEVINAADNAFGRKDYPTALKYYIEAFRRDDSLGEIAYTIGEIYYRGHDIQEKTQKGGGRYASMNDYYHRGQKAKPWFQKANDLGIDTSNELLQKAQEFYDVKDYKHYHKALHECVDKNYKCEKAINLLIESYEKGIGCKADTVEAYYLRKDRKDLFDDDCSNPNYDLDTLPSNENESNLSLQEEDKANTTFVPEDNIHPLIGKEIQKFSTFSSNDKEMVIYIMILSVISTYLGWFADPDFEFSGCSIAVIILVLVVRMFPFLLLVMWVQQVGLKSIIYNTNYNIYEFGFEMTQTNRFFKQKQLKVMVDFGIIERMSVKLEKRNGKNIYRNHKFFNSKNECVARIRNNDASECIYNQYSKYLEMEKSAINSKS